MEPNLDPASVQKSRVYTVPAGVVSEDPLGRLLHSALFFTPTKFNYSLHTKAAAKCNWTDLKPSKTLNFDAE